LIGVSLALATLAKGLVPLALALPGAYFLRRYWRQWWWIAVGFIPVAVPWYAVMCIRFGKEFVQEFFVKHHLQRLYSASLQHVQPWYYYIPVLLAALFPWTPGLALLISRRQPWDPRRSFLLSTVIFGFVFFSISRNKLPGYLLPIIPVIFVLIAGYYEGRVVSRTSRALFLSCAALIAAVPLLTAVVANSLSAGRFAWSTAALSRTTLFYVAAPVVVVFLARRSFIGPLLVLCLVVSGLYLKAVLYPILDRDASARSLWRSLGHDPRGICDAGTRRDWIYGLSFYAGHAIPGCEPDDPRLHIHSWGHDRPVVTN
jgi:4-amino-4-deoxy-L-arabinose transferase-like glycosyltransferase